MPSTLRRPRPLKLVLAGIIVALAAMWVYALAFAPKRFLLAIGDEDWVAQAEARCANAQAAIDALPPAERFADIQPRVEALRQRADVLDQANAMVDDLIAGLRALAPPDNTKGATLVERWLADWDTYAGDRRAQADRWRAGVDDPFEVAADSSGTPITEFMDAFADGNHMPSCAVPGDV